MPSYVIIWENNTLGHQKVPGHSWPGHSAINIGGKFHKASDVNAEKHYVSWWPENSASFDVAGALFGLNKTGDTALTLTGDIGSEGYFPDHVIELQTTETQEARMRTEWATIRAKEEKYKTLRNNCSTICSRILHDGGFYANKWAIDNNFAWSPADIRRLAMSSGSARMMTWRDVKILAYNGGQGLNLGDNNIKDRFDKPIATARSGRYCSTGAAVSHQTGETFQGD